MQSNYKEAIDILKKAQDQFINIGDQFGTAQCSRCLGNILFMQSNYEEATKIIKEAQEQFIDIGCHLGASHCSQILGDIHCMQSKANEFSFIGVCHVNPI
jgi:tetratricopeptide (TPR) repeat protein